jgi:hypothetical protein
MTHRHLIEKPNPPYLCECGEVFDTSTERWRSPKKNDGDGLARREAWKPEEEA